MRIWTSPDWSMPVAAQHRISDRSCQHPRLGTTPLCLVVFRHTPVMLNERMNKSICYNSCFTNNFYLVQCVGIFWKILNSNLDCLKPCHYFCRYSLELYFIINFLQVQRSEVLFMIETIQLCLGVLLCTVRSKCD